MAADAGIVVVWIVGILLSVLVLWFLCALPNVSPKSDFKNKLWVLFEIYSKKYKDQMRLALVFVGFVSYVLAVVDAGRSNNKIYLVSAICGLLGYLVTISSVFETIQEFMESIRHGKWGLSTQAERFNEQQRSVGEAKPQADYIGASSAVGGDSGNNKMPAGAGQIAEKSTGAKSAPAGSAEMLPPAALALDGVYLTSRGTLHYPSIAFLERKAFPKDFKEYVQTTLDAQKFRNGKYFGSLEFENGSTFPNEFPVEVAYITTNREWSEFKRPYAAAQITSGAVNLRRFLENEYGPRKLTVYCLWVKSVDRRDDGDYFCSKLSLNNMFATLKLELQYTFE